MANLYCVKIRGYVKGADYGQGQDLTECDSAWSAVLVDGEWRLLDVYWATCYRVHPDDSSWELIDDGQNLSNLAPTPRGQQMLSKTEYAYNDYYFLTGTVNTLLLLLLHLPTLQGSFMQLKKMAVSLSKLRFLKKKKKKIGTKLWFRKGLRFVKV